MSDEVRCYGCVYHTPHLLYKCDYLDKAGHSRGTSVYSCTLWTAKEKGIRGLRLENIAIRSGKRVKASGDKR